MARPQGPLISLDAPNVVTTCPLASSTYSPPDAAVLEVPSWVNTDPAKTSPACTTPRALVKPMGGVPWKNNPGWPLWGAMVMSEHPATMVRRSLQVEPG